jgi:hypothetical protein
MNIWLVTTGSSDIQLTKNEYWKDWYSDGSPVKKKCHSLEFKPTQIFEDSEEPYRIASRVLGWVYKAQQDEVWEFLTFPLLDQFATQLKGKVIDKIIILLTDQSEKFKEELQEDIRCPYWQDTCELQDIIERYFKQSDKFPDSKLIPIILSPGENKPGLDDWDYILEIVQNKLHKIKFDSEPNTVYVSHQAGTPAISSAVQFVSLGKFGTKVQFLVSNEYEKKALEPIESPKYLKGIKFEQAKELLKNHDYAAVKSLLNDYLDSETKILLDAAIQWNYAKFDGFAKKLQQLSDKLFLEEVNARTKKENWWWTAYESFYLAVVRLNQKNTVEAIFHSFRAVEGLLSKWVHKCHNEKLQTNSQGVKEIKTLQKRTYKAHGKELYLFFKLDRGKVNDDLSAFGENVFNKRNQLFHQIEGLQDSKAVFDFWEVSSKNEQKWKTGNLSDEQKWQNRVLGCLNCISGQKLTLEKASLMAQVHEKLVNAIASYSP